MQTVPGSGMLRVARLEGMDLENPDLENLAEEAVHFCAGRSVIHFGTSASILWGRGLPSAMAERSSQDPPRDTKLSGRR